MSESTRQSKARPSEVVHLDTRVLLARHINGDQHAFPQLIAKFQRQVYSYLVRSGVPVEARDDLFQEVFIKVHHSASSYQTDRPLEPWLFTIVANSTRSYFRKQVIQQRLRNEFEADVSQNKVYNDDAVEALETTEWLEQKITLLPEKQREVIVLCCLDNLSQKQVAQILNCPIATIKTNLRRARLSLAKALVVRNHALNGGDSV